MKKTMTVKNFAVGIPGALVAILLSVGVGFSARADLKIVAPKEGETVPLLTEAQKAYLALPRETRRQKFADRHFRSKEMGLPAETVPGEAKPRAAYWPKTVRLAWTATDGAAYAVRVTDAKKREVVFSETVKGGEIRIDNLEIAATYEWTVEGAGERAQGRFGTEDLAPRLLRFSGVPNVRDLGGRIGLGGRRVKQGMVFRSAGLNDNASARYYTVDELKADGRYEAEKAKCVATKARLEQLKAWQKNPATMDRGDAEYKSWCGRHPNDPVSVFLSGRIKRAEEKMTKDGEPRVFKCRVPGKSRVAGENGAAILSRFGIRSDIDLRSDGECFGMTGSPLGDTVTWFHYSSSAYGNMQAKGGKEAFAKVFRVFLDERNYPIDFHCIAGQDRTGAVAFILNALLGVAEEELYLDWEATGFWNRGASFCHERLFDHLVSGFSKNYAAPTLRESCEKYVRDLGFTDADIAKLRDLLLEK